MRTTMRSTTATQRRWIGGCLGVALLAALGFGLLVVATTYYASSKLGQTVPPPGDPRRFDPVASYADVVAFAGADARLVALDAHFVRSDGTLDLKADYRPSPGAEYRFVRDIAAPANAPPIGAGGTLDGRWHEPVHVVVSRPWTFRSVRRIGGTRGGASYQYFDRGMGRRVNPASGQAPAPAVAAPGCPFRRLWVDAIARGAPAAAVAHIHYDHRGYAFNIAALRFAMQFDPDCTVVSVRGITPAGNPRSPPRPRPGLPCAGDGCRR